MGDYLVKESLTPDLGVTGMWESRLGLAPGELHERMDDAWRRGSIGTISEDEVHQALTERIGLDARQLADFMGATLKAIERRIPPTRSHQFVVGAIFDEATVIEGQQHVTDNDVLHAGEVPRPGGRVYRAGRGRSGPGIRPAHTHPGHLRCLGVADGSRR